MRESVPSTEDAGSPSPSPLRLRLGVTLILLWWTPFWALAPRIANSLSGMSNPPSVADVTTAIVIIQTIIGLIGFWVAGAEVKSIIKSSTKKRALATIWYIFIHGDVRDHDNVGSDSDSGRPQNEA